MFSPAITGFWRGPFGTGETTEGGDGFSVTINPAPGGGFRVSILAPAGGPAAASVSPEVADLLGIRGIRIPEAAFRRGLADAGIALHEPDCLFYFTHKAERALVREPQHDGVRRLTADDASAFARFESSSSAEDLDEAYVELDHWAVFGCFLDDRIVCAASAYPWRGSSLADIGVLTLSGFRGRGHARSVVRALGAHAASRGYHPQYRCQPGNAASRAVAAAAGFTYFGLWQAASPAGDGA